MKNKLKDLNIIIGMQLRKERVFRGISQEELGNSLGVSFQQLQKYEKGLNRVSLASLFVMLDHMGIEIEKFIKKVKDQTNSAPRIDELNYANTTEIKNYMALPVKVRRRIVRWVKILEREVKKNGN